MRRLRLFILLLTLGSMINIAVAWGFALIDRERDYFGHHKGIETGLWAKWGRIQTICLDVPGEVRIEQEPKRWHGTDISDRWWKGPNAEQERNKHIPSWSRFRTEDPIIMLKERGDTRNLDYTERATGWPMLALRYTHLSHWRGYQNPSVTVQSSGLWLAPWESEKLRRDLPFRPIVAGFALNTILYATLVWLAFAAPFLARQRLRRSRGLCPQCAYPIGTSAVCTECGKRLHDPG